MNALKRSWYAVVRYEDLREQDMDEVRLREKCYHMIQYEPYSRCDLSEDICMEDIGSLGLDTVCENNTTREKK